METIILNPAKVNMVKNILRYTFGILPIITGIDKFFDLLVDWDKYLTPLANYIPFSSHTFMLIVGIIEIIAGIIVLIIPRVGAYIVAIWLLCIVIVLVWGMYFDIAARDLVMAISAFCLGELYSFKQKENKEKVI
jgi:uncharacterized membrane protein YphA (DoxX/SURF4 family)